MTEDSTHLSRLNPKYYLPHTHPRKNLPSFVFHVGRKDKKYYVSDLTSSKLMTSNTEYMVTTLKFISPNISLQLQTLIVNCFLNIPSWAVIGIY